MRRTIAEGLHSSIIPKLLTDKVAIWVIMASEMQRCVSLHIHVCIGHSTLSTNQGDSPPSQDLPGTPRTFCSPGCLRRWSSCPPDLVPRREPPPCTSVGYCGVCEWGWGMWVWEVRDVSVPVCACGIGCRENCVLHLRLCLHIIEMLQLQDQLLALLQQVQVVPTEQYIIKHTPTTLYVHQLLPKITSHRYYRVDWHYYW